MKNPNRPRTAHKLNLRNGDVVRLDAWENCVATRVGELFTVANGRIGGIGGIPSGVPKGYRPLFTVISRAADLKPDEVLTIHKRDKAYRLTFPAGSDTGTVTREKL